jgi:choline dehydrogenase-like flavoprotein
VLLVEAGVENTELTNRIPGERYDFFAKNGAALDYGYKTAPQKETGGREIPYHRGKCLGGSTATNMCIWDYGSKEELNEWAGLVGNDTWKWENSLERLKNVCSSVRAHTSYLKWTYKMTYRLKITTIIHQQSMRNM